METTKILKPYTIIPSELYVQRDADRQLQNIINDMGRPGYVLVSRQMGKTNLLLNAKRRLETPDDVFVYVDLSNPFETAKDCFENIIDTALETNPEKFVAVNSTIVEKRTQYRDTPPHKQHTNELRLLLSAIPGKLVIILDEIDALTKTRYSDQIFAQIRSIYFSRVNFKELEKLTYILSGVVEPTEIIKDPKISPFNIGQKIFLNDFDRNEFEQFLVKSKLELSQEISDSIFYWTNGNPRMTWDVCSEVENRIKTHTLKKESIDKIVSDIYLRTFDRPPIDNIRELVKNDREIRNAVVEIEYSKGKEVSDKVKSKLYLSGIINYEEDDIRIKNRIIKESLNLTWIKSLEEEDRGLIRIAIEAFEQGNYKDSLKSFEKFLVESQFNDEDRPLFYYYMGYASYRQSDFAKAIQYLNNAKFDVDEAPKWYYRTLNVLGSAYYYLDEINESLSCFKQVMDSGRKDEIYAQALLNFGSTSVHSGQIEHRSDAIAIFNGIIDETSLNKQKIKEDFVKELKSIAHYNLAEIQKANGEYESAIQNYKHAISLGKLNNKPTLILAFLNISNSKEDNFELLDHLINLIGSGEIKPVDSDPDKPIEFSFSDLKSIAVYAFINFRDTLFERLIPNLKLLGEKTLPLHLYDLALYASNIQQDMGATFLLLRELYKELSSSENEIDPHLQYNILKALAYLDPQSYSVCFDYVSIFKEKRFAEVDHIDVENFSNLIFYCIENRRYSEALSFVELIKSARPSISENTLSLNYLVIDHFELNLHNYLGNRENVIKKAQEILEILKDDEVKISSQKVLGENGYDIIKSNAKAALHPKKFPDFPFITPRKYSRNQTVRVRYKDGTIIEAKYKRIEDDLKSGECVVLI